MSIGSDPADRELLPEGWRSVERADDRIEYERASGEEWGTDLVLLRAVRTCTGPVAGRAGPLWDLQVETRSGEVSTSRSFGNAGCRADARRKLARAMETVESVADHVNGGPLTAAKLRTALDATEPSQPLTETHR
ncbi:hypothetical protein [Halobaculum rarum]|uniref:hypothetical protein n=1 Tax=Halobaculum rarum TaxID=3075122 RepID=UPI0032AF6C81